MPSQPFKPQSFTNFGDLLKYLRRRERLTQLELSITVGYSESQISRLEKNQRLPDITALKALFIPALHLEEEPEITARLLELAQSARQEDAPAPGIPPYKGLLFFDESDAELFFGREDLTSRLADRVADLAMDASTRFLAVVGASGSGKSSLIRAGLAVRLKRAGWEVRIFTPTDHPLRMLNSHARLEHGNPGAEQTLLLVDQFEETFTLCRSETERLAFIEKLLSFARGTSSKVTVVAALRADFYSHCAQYPVLRQAVAAEQEYIGQMTTEELRHAIEEPAKHGGWEFESGLVEMLLQDVGAHGSSEPEPGALPLLSHALLSTWEHRRGRLFTIEGYRASGGVRGAIAETAESIFTDHLNQAQQELARHIFLRLTELGEGTEDTRRRVALNELVRQPGEATQLRAVLNTLAEARLITLGEDSAEVAHEALIREWQRLHEWLNEDRDGLRLHRHLTEATHDWEVLERDPGSLYRGARLAQAREWSALNPKSLNEGEHAFLEASVDQEQHEERQRETQRQRELETARQLAESEHNRAEEQIHAKNRMQARNRIITVIGVIAVAFGALAMLNFTRANQNAEDAKTNLQQALTAEALALDEKERADQERDKALAAQTNAQSRELAIAALNNLNADPERSILLALQAIAQSDTPEAQDALHRAIQASRVELTVRHTDVVEHITYSPDGTRFATASDDGTAKVWDAATGHELFTLKTGPSAAVAFSLDGARLATANYRSKTAIVWDAVTGQELLILAGHTGGVNQVVFSPDSTRIATAGEDTTTKLWDAITGQELFTLSGHTDIVSSVAFNPDGTRLVTGSWDHTVKVWDAVTGRELLTFSDFTETVEAVFSPDGRYIATNSGNNAQLWDLSTGKERTVLLGHTGLVEQVVFSADEKHLATASLDGTAKIWDAETGTELITLSGHASSVISVAFSPDGIHVATASNDGTARVWDISPSGSREWLTIVNHADAVEEVVYSPDGTRLATASDDGTVKVFDAITGTELLSLSGHAARVYSISFNPDGTRLATASEDNTTKIWNAITGEELLSLSGHGDGIVGGSFPGVLAVEYDPDGKQLATVGADGNAVLWDAVTGEQIARFSNNGIGITNVAFSPDGRHLVFTTDQPPAAVAGEDATTQAWDLITGQKLYTATQAVRIWGLDFSNDGKRFATAGFGGIVKIRDAVTGRELLDLSGHTSTVVSVAFSPDDQYIATASVDGTTKIWDAETGRELLTLTGHTRPVMSVSFSPDGTRLATSSQDGTVRVYLLKIEDLIKLAKSRATRSLTTEECQRYLHLEQCP